MKNTETTDKWEPVCVCVCPDLAVSNIGISEGVCSEDPPQGGDSHLILKGRMFR